MPRDSRDLLEVLKSELNFLEKGGYGRSPRAPWKPQLIFEDSPSCMNFDSPDDRQPCNDCILMQLVPPEQRSEKIPCRHIPLTKAGDTVDFYYRWGTHQELEEALANWLRAAIQRVEAERSSAGPGPRGEVCVRVK